MDPNWKKFTEDMRKVDDFSFEILEQSADYYEVRCLYDDLLAQIKSMDIPAKLPEGEV